MSFVMWISFILANVLVLPCIYGKSVNFNASSGQLDERFAVATTPKITATYALSRYERGLEDYEEESEGRGMSNHEDPHYHEHQETPKEQKAAKSDIWGGYYDFLINEGSYKFWATFQLATAALLIYSALAAIYYSKFNYITTDYDYDYYGGVGKRSIQSRDPWLGLSVQTVQRILHAISSDKYT